MRKGFSLIEVLVVVGISALLLGVAIGGQREFSRRKISENAASILASELRQLQTKSTSGVKPNDTECQGNFRLDGYSVTFTSTGYDVIALCSDGSTTNEVDVGSYDYHEGAVATSYPPASQPIVFRTVGQGTNLSSSQAIGLCALNYGKEIVIAPGGDVTIQDYECAAATSTPSPTPSPAPTAPPSLPSGPSSTPSPAPTIIGLSRTSYSNLDFTGEEKVTIDPNINFNWMLWGPFSTSLLDFDNTFSVRWIGFLTPQLTGRYVFYTESDDGVRLNVNGSTIIDNWTDHGVVEDTSPSMVLQAGQRYPLLLEYYDNQVASLIRLYWSADGLDLSAGQIISKQIVPSSVLSVN